MAAADIQTHSDDGWPILPFETADGFEAVEERVARLTAEGRMRPSGRAEVDAAKADGRF